MSWIYVISAALDIGRVLDSMIHEPMDMLEPKVELVTSCGMVEDILE